MKYHLYPNILPPDMIELFKSEFINSGYKEDQFNSFIMAVTEPNGMPPDILLMVLQDFRFKWSFDGTDIFLSTSNNEDMHRYFK